MSNFLGYVDKIKLLSIKELNIRGRKSYELEDYYVSFWEDEEGSILNGLQFMSKKDNFFWTWEKPESFYNDYILSGKTVFHIHSFRKYGESKLSKPKVLKGIKQSFSVKYLKSKCQVFIKDSNVWIKHRDYFSPSMLLPSEDSGTPMEYLIKKYVGKDRNKKFIYGDAWGDIVLRQEAWLKIENLVNVVKKVFELDILDSIMRQMEKYHGKEEYSLRPSEMERFIERVVSELKNI